MIQIIFRKSPYPGYIKPEQLRENKHDKEKNPTLVVEKKKKIMLCQHFI